MISIRNYLLRYLLLALISIAIISGNIAYFTTQHEIAELLERNLKQVAQALEKQQLAMELSKHEGSEHFYETLVSNPTKPKIGDETYFIQIWDNTKLVYSSHAFFDLPRPIHAGFIDNTFEGGMWRSYAVHVDDATIQVSQPFDMQHEMVNEITLGILITLAAQIPIFALVIWLIVGRSLKPLMVVSSAISKRGTYQLAPLQMHETPTEIQPLVGELNDLLQRLGNALHMQRQFTADAAHELRTPLTAIQLQLDILRRAQNEDERHEAMQKLAAGIQRSIHLAQQLLLSARIEPDGAARDIQTLDMAAIAKGAVEQFAEAAALKNIRIGFASNGPANVSADAENLRVLINNLIDNAIRYTPADGEVEVRVDAQQGAGILVVADSGVGIEPSEHTRIFDRFYRVPGSAAFGTGLGLSIVKTIADTNHATITLAEGIHGRGVAFTVTFPALPH